MLNGPKSPLELGKKKKKKKRKLDSYVLGNSHRRMIANSNKGFLLALCALMLGSAMIQTCEGIEWIVRFRKYHVRVENGLQGQPLNVHCQSKDNDLGIHVLQPGDQFEWGFHINFMGKTLFFCNMWWESGHKSFEVFKAGEHKLILDFCGAKTCQYRATEEGVQIFHSKNKAWELKYPWDK